MNDVDTDLTQISEPVQNTSFSFANENARQFTMLDLTSTSYSVERVLSSETASVLQLVDSSNADVLAVNSASISGVQATLRADIYMLYLQNSASSVTVNTSYAGLPDSVALMQPLQTACTALVAGSRHQHHPCDALLVGGGFLAAACGAPAGG